MKATVLSPIGRKPWRRSYPSNPVQKLLVQYGGLCACLMAAWSAGLSGCVAPPQPHYQPPPPPPPPPPAPVATANAMELQRVTSDPAPEFAPRISPDGNQLLFYVVDHTAEGRYGNLRLADAVSVAAVSIGSSGRKLVAGPGAWFASWYPDGKHIVYSYHKTPKPTLVRSPYGGVGMTFIAPSAMGESDGQGVVSPDGKRLAFHTMIGEQVHVCTVNADGSSFTVYAPGASPRWHPNGTILAFERTVGDHGQIFTIDLASGQVTQLTTGAASSTFPVWSQDGSWIVFSSNRDGKWHIYLMKADGSSVTQLTKGGAEAGWPDWGADGWVYFTSNAGAPTATGSDPWAWRFADIWRVKPVLPE